jgi:hypothetical protein
MAENRKWLLASPIAYNNSTLPSPDRREKPAESHQKKIQTALIADSAEKARSHRNPVGGFMLGSDMLKRGNEWFG